MATVLAVDDDQALLRVLRIGLSALGHDVLVASTGEQGISQAAIGAPDIIVLDLGLPDIDGMEVCRRIRQWSDVPIIVLSADGTEDRKIASLDGGADDYMTKPFGMGELEARIRVALRHRTSEPGEEETKDIVVGGLELDLVHHEARINGQPRRAHDTGVRPPRVPGSARRQDLHASHDPRARVGTPLRHRDPVPAGVRLPTAAQARRRTRARSCAPTPGSDTNSSTRTPSSRDTGSEDPPARRRRISLWAPGQKGDVDDSQAVR